MAAISHALLHLHCICNCAIKCYPLRCTSARNSEAWQSWAQGMSGRCFPRKVPELAPPALQEHTGHIGYTSATQRSKSQRPNQQHSRTVPVDQGLWQSIKCGTFVPAQEPRSLHQASGQARSTLCTAYAFRANLRTGKAASFLACFSVFLLAWGWTQWARGRGKDQGQRRWQWQYHKHVTSEKLRASQTKHLVRMGRYAGGKY